MGRSENWPSVYIIMKYKRNFNSLCSLSKRKCRKCPPNPPSSRLTASGILLIWLDAYLNIFFFRKFITKTNVIDFKQNVCCYKKSWKGPESSSVYDDVEKDVSMLQKNCTVKITVDVINKMHSTFTYKYLN